MNAISEEALRRFKRVDPDEILNEAQQRLSDISVEIRQKWQEGLYHETNGHRELGELRRYISSRAALMASGLESHQKYLASHNDDKFTSQEIQEHNKHMDETSLYLSFLADEIAKFPSLPVLPPPAPLIKVSGIIEKVEFTKAMACFDAEVYSTVRDELERKRQRDNIGALVAMTAQVLSGAPPHAMIQDGRLKKQKCLYVKGKIDGKTFSGWFGMTDVRVGDRVDMAVMPEGDGYLAYAVANSERGTISLTPGCYESIATNMKIIKLYPVVMLLPFIPFMIFANFTISLIIYVVVSLFFVIYSFNQFNNRERVKCQLYGDISRALLDCRQENADILINSRGIYIKKKKSGELTPRGKEGIPTPQPGDHNYGNEFFYYY